MLNSKGSETLVLHVFSLRRARARYILRIKPDDVLGNPGVTHHSSQWPGTECSGHGTGHDSRLG